MTRFHWFALRAVACAGLTLVLLLLSGATARADSAEDAAAVQTAREVLDGDYASGDLVAAQKKVEAALARCTNKCGSMAQASLRVILGMISSRSGRRTEAIAQFQQALGLDPDAVLPPGCTPGIRGEWDEAKDESGQEANVSADVPTTTPAQPHVRPGVEALHEYRAALAAEKSGEPAVCIEHAKKSLELKESARVRLHLSSCEARSGHLMDALQDARDAFDLATRKRDRAVTQLARERMEALRRRVPHVTFQPDAGVEWLNVSLDGHALPVGSLTTHFAVDPGEHAVHAEGSQNGIQESLDAKYTVEESQLLAIPLVYRGIGIGGGGGGAQATDVRAEYLTPGQLQCMLSAKTQEDVLKCIPQKRHAFVVKAGTQLSGYSDTTSVDVWSPEIDGEVTSPTQGWNVGGHFLVDVVSAASPDVVSTASPPFKEQRYAGGIDGGYKFKTVGAQMQANYSQETDYISRGAGLALTMDLADKLVTPHLSGNFNHDNIGRGPNNFINTLDTTELEAGVTIVLSPSSLLLVGATAQLERGDQSKLYRYIPMFDPQVAQSIIPGASIDQVNALRLQARPTEQLPTARDRYAVGARFAHRFSSATLRLEQRLYNDSWSLKATTTDVRYVFDVGRHLLLWPHLRFNAQTGANFFKLAYSATADANTGQLVLPLFRTTDRELSPLVSATAGAGSRYLLSPPNADTQFGVFIQADVMYTKYFDALYITDRTAVYGTVGFDAEFE